MDYTPLFPPHLWGTRSHFKKEFHKVKTYGVQYVDPWKIGAGFTQTSIKDGVCRKHKFILKMQ